MISSEDGKVSVVGTLPKVRAELTVLIQNLYNDILIVECGMAPEEAKKLILETVEHGFFTEAQKAQKAADLLGDVLKAIAEKLKGMGDN